MRQIKDSEYRNIVQFLWLHKSKQKAESDAYWGEKLSKDEKLRIKEYRTFYSDKDDSFGVYFSIY